MSCICHFCEDEGQEELDFFCPFCFAHCPDQLEVRGADVEEQRFARAHTALLRWTFHRWQRVLHGRMLDPIEWVRRMKAGEVPPTVEELFWGPETQASRDRLRFIQQCEDEGS